MRRCIAALATAALLLPFAFSPAANALETVSLEARVREALTKADVRTARGTYTVKLTMSPHTPEERKLEGGGIMEFERKAGDTITADAERFVLDFWAEGTQPDRYETWQRCVYDGSKLVIATRSGVLEGEHAAAVKTNTGERPMSLLATFMPVPGMMFFTALNSDLPYRSERPAQKIDGHEVYVLEASPQAKSPFKRALSRAVYYIDKQLGLARRVEFFDNQDNPWLEVQFTELVVNAPIDPRAFVPPAVDAQTK